MNLFRSEEHVRRWSLYYPAAEDYIMPVVDWAKVFSVPTFRNRLDAEYLEKASIYLEEYHQALQDLGKPSPYWQFPFISQLEEVKLSRYRIIGNYTRYDNAVLNSLKDACHNITSGFEGNGKRRDNHLIWASPGSGKTFFIESIAGTLGNEIEYVEINLAKMSQETMYDQLLSLESRQNPVLLLLDEIDAQQEATWPYEMLLPFLDTIVGQEPKLVCVMAGSSGYSIEGMKQRMMARPKGQDLLSRIPSQNEYIIPPLSFGDRVLVVLSQFVRAGTTAGREIRYVEKLGLYYIALSSRLASPRQLYEFAIRAVERGSRNDDRVKYDQLFAPGDPENKRFWLEVSSVAGDLVNSYVLIEAGATR
ncbi:MAG TPA: AAA family ATPase [Anaerolineales bacterium]|nr:AAA family ATPase [Anaerolineales bacterium]